MKRRIFVFGKHTYQEYQYSTPAEESTYRIDGRLLGTGQDLAVTAESMCVVRSANREKFLVTAAQTPEEGVFWYDELPEGRTVRVGRFAQSDIALSFFRGGEYISGDMAHLCRSGDTVRVEAVGKNGIYLNGRAAGRECLMRQGDHLHIWGTDFVWTGACMAVRTECPIDSVADRLQQDPEPEMTVEPVYEPVCAPGSAAGGGTSGDGSMCRLTGFDLLEPGDRTFSVF
ncbi:MAG: FHA domain-containing protein [Lachnospiraceae bacterium]|nr:FHA domain-containing protein [Lachnospiraceae bacterium]